MSPEMVVNVATVPLPLAGHHHQGAGGLAVIDQVLQRNNIRIYIDTRSHIYKVPSRQPLG